MGLKFSNFGKAIIASAPDGTIGLNFTVESGKGLLFPALSTGDYFYGIFKDASGNKEIVKVVTRGTDSMTIEVGGRGLDGTQARTWAAGDYFVAGLTNIALTESLSNENLAAFGALPSAPDKLPYFTGAGEVGMADLSAFSRTLLDDADAAAMRTTLGIAAAVAAGFFQTGVSMLFYNPTAPVGWTHDLATLNHALRVVPGAGTGGTTGGTVDFTTAFTSQAVSGSNSAVTLTKAQIPPHTHGVGRGGVGSISQGVQPDDSEEIQSTDGSAQGLGGESHNHTFTGTAINLAVKYMNMIRATKN